MKSGSRSNALLVELLIVVMFFMLTTTVLLEVFAKANQFSSRSDLLTVSLVKAQNVADQLYAAEDADSVLAGYGFTAQDGGWILEKDGYSLKVVLREDETDAGILRTYDISGVEGDKTLLTLPSARYLPKEVSP